MLEIRCLEGFQLRKALQKRQTLLPVSGEAHALRLGACTAAERVQSVFCALTSGLDILLDLKEGHFRTLTVSGFGGPVQRSPALQTGG